MEALDTFIAKRPEFKVDSRWEKFFLSFNPRGYLRRVASVATLGPAAELLQIVAAI
jgi:hypothetical protein